MKTPVVVLLPTLEDGRMSLERMIQKPMVMSKRELWVTRRKMVDGLTPHLPNFGLRKEKMGRDESWASSPFSLVIGDGSGWEAAD